MTYHAKLIQNEIESSAQLECMTINSVDQSSTVHEAALAMKDAFPCLFECDLKTAVEAIMPWWNDSHRE